MVIPCLRFKINRLRKGIESPNPRFSHGLGWVGLRPFLVAYLPRFALPFPARLNWEQRICVPSLNICWTADHHQTPQWRSQAGDTAVTVCVPVWEGKTILLQGTVGSCSPCAHRSWIVEGIYVQYAYARIHPHMHG